MTVSKHDWVLEVATALFFLWAGIWILSPLFDPMGSVAFLISKSAVFPKIVAIVEIAISIFFLVNMKFLTWPRKEKVRAVCVMAFACLYLFFGLAQVMLIGIGGIGYWVYFVLCVSLAARYLKIKENMRQ